MEQTAPFVLGDSIAEGVQQANGLSGMAKVGASPEQVLQFATSVPQNQVSGRSVVLSSGVSNNPAQIELVAQQVAALKAAGASEVRLVGVDDRTYPGVNKKLSQIAQQSGATFLGPIQAGPDGVHPTNYHGLGLGGRALASAGGALDNDTRQQILAQATAGTMVPPWLLNGLITQESQWGPNRKGSGTDLGLAQITDSTAASPGYGMQPISREDRLDPYKSARWAAQYLEARGKALGLTEPEHWTNPNTYSKALTAYNGGGDPNYAQNVRQYIPTDFGGTGKSGTPAPSGFVDGSGSTGSALIPQSPQQSQNWIPPVNSGMNLQPQSDPKSLLLPMMLQQTLAGMKKGWKAIPVDYDPFKNDFPRAPDVPVLLNGSRTGTLPSLNG